MDQKLLPNNSALKTLIWLIKPVQVKGQFILTHITNSEQKQKAHMEINLSALNVRGTLRIKCKFSLTPPTPLPLSSRNCTLVCADDWPLGNRIYASGDCTDTKAFNKWLFRVTTFYYFPTANLYPHLFLSSFLHTEHT